MTWLKRAAVGLCAVVTLSPVASAQVVQTFEDFSPCNNTAFGVGQYGAVNYLNQWTCFSFPSFPFTPHSGTNLVYTNPNQVGEFTFAPTTFVGAWFSGGATINFQLFFQGGLVATSGGLVTNSVPAFLPSGYSGSVDRVRVIGNSVNYVMDDVTFSSLSVPSVVPEPASIVLVGTGLVGVAAFVRRRRRTAP